MPKTIMSPRRFGSAILSQETRPLLGIVLRILIRVYFLSHQLLSWRQGRRLFSTSLNRHMNLFNTDHGGNGQNSFSDMRLIMCIVVVSYYAAVSWFEPHKRILAPYKQRPGTRVRVSCKGNVLGFGMLCMFYGNYLLLSVHFWPVFWAFIVSIPLWRIKVFFLQQLKRIQAKRLRASSIFRWLLKGHSYISNKLLLFCQYICCCWTRQLEKAPPRPPAPVPAKRKRAASTVPVSDITHFSGAWYLVLVMFVIYFVCAKLEVRRSLLS